MRLSDTFGVRVDCGSGSSAELCVAEGGWLLPGEAEVRLRVDAAAIQLFPVEKVCACHLVRAHQPLPLQFMHA